MNPIELCMFCDADPCECNGPVKKKPARRKPAQEAVAKPVRKVNQRQPAERKPMVSASQQRHEAQQAEKRQQEDDLLKAVLALHSLDMLHPSEADRLGKLVASNPNAADIIEEVL